jgi:hypothetical protein
MSLGVEADHGEIIAWAHEMRAWINLTTGGYHGVVAAARNGTEVTPHYSVAVTLADEVVQASTDFDGRERAPMRLAEARITLGVVKAREGDLEGAVNLGMRAIAGDRKSLPSLLMVSRDLTKTLKDRYPTATQTQDCEDQLDVLTAAASS